MQVTYRLVIQIKINHIIYDVNWFQNGYFYKHEVYKYTIAIM